MKKLPDNISLEKILPQYDKLINLKKALKINDNEEINELLILERAREHNLKEIYLIGYLVDMVMNAPKELKEEHNLLMNYYNSPKDYLKVLQQIKKLYKSNPKCKKYACNIFNDLDLAYWRNCAITNLAIYGLCPELITKTVSLEPKNVILNFHILQKWLNKQRKINLNTLNIIEQKIILYLANGYNPDELINERVMEGKTVDNERIRTILYEILPARCNVQSICQVMAVMFMNNPDLCDIEKSFNMLENLLKNEGL